LIFLQTHRRRILLGTVRSIPVFLHADSLERSTRRNVRIRVLRSRVEIERRIMITARPGAKFSKLSFIVEADRIWHKNRRRLTTYRLDDIKGLWPVSVS